MAKPRNAMLVFALALTGAAGACTDVENAAGKYDDYEGEAAGEYEVFGSHTFTVGDATDETGKVRPLLG